MGVDVETTCPSRLTEIVASFSPVGSLSSIWVWPNSAPKPACKVKDVSHL